MITLHIGNKNYSSWSMRPWLAMREAGIGFEERMHPFEPDGDWRELRALSPSGKVPCLVDGGLVVWDSLAIVEYLHERNGGVWPADAGARAWARCAAAEMHAGFTTLRSRCSMSCGVRIRLHEVEPALRADLTRIATIFEDGLARFGGPFLAGERFSAVDAFYAPIAFRVQTYGLEVPATARAYMDRILALPSVEEWYRAGLREPWREIGHDEDCLRAGTLVADLRG